jgi:phenylacetic acid degradation operon negative regulatory protein
MAPPRNAPGDEELGLRPLTARSVLLSTLLGLDPPELPAARLVATAGLFGIAEGTARVALSRMLRAGEAVTDGARYRLTGRLLERQARQASGRHPRPRAWRGRWHVAVVTTPGRPAAERAALRRAFSEGRMAEWREGVWVRPDNLERPVASDGVEWMSAQPDEPPIHLWDLDAHAARGDALRRRLEEPPDIDALAPGFVLSAAVLRHLAADPLLPTELLPQRWPNDALRAEYDEWDRAYRTLLATWHRAGASTVPAR